jgi:hypothetical protein
MTDPTIPDDKVTDASAAETAGVLTSGAAATRGTEPVEGSPTRDFDKLSHRPPKNLFQQVLGQWPLAVVLAGVLTGLAIVATSHWRMGATLIGASITLGGLLRLLPNRRVGLLAVRGKALDAIVLLGVGIGIVALAFLVPPSRG